jgi:hypothetical protein
MKNVMYQQIEERKVMMVRNLLHFLNVDVNQNNINNMNNILTEFNRLDRFLSDSTNFKETKEEYNKRMDEDLTLTY